MGPVETSIFCFIAKFALLHDDLFFDGVELGEVKSTSFHALTDLPEKKSKKLDVDEMKMT